MPAQGTLSLIGEFILPIMHRIFSALLVLAWGVWFGAIVMVFVTVTSLFATFTEQRSIAGVAAAGIFRRFEMMELGAAAAALVAATLLRSHARPRTAAAVIILLLAAAVGALYTGLVLTPKIDSLRGERTSESFRSLHALSSAIYVVQACLLLATGVFLPSFLARRDISAATVPA